MIKEFPYNRIVKTNVKLPEPSDMAVKRQLDLDEQKARCVQAVKGIGIFPIEKIYKDYYRLTDAEIGKIKEQLKKEQKDPIFGPMTMAGMGGPGGPPMGAPGMDAMGDQQGYNDAGNQESAENEPPTQDNSKSQSKREEITYDDTIELLKESGGSLEAIKVLMELKSSNKINS